MSSVVHRFTDPPIKLSDLLTNRSDIQARLRYARPSKDAGTVLARGTPETFNSKAGFYVILLNSGIQPRKVLKIGRANHGMGGLLARLRDYVTRYGDAWVLFLRVFPFKRETVVQNQPVSVYERKIIKALARHSVYPVRGDEYFPADNVSTLTLMSVIDPDNHAMPGPRANLSEGRSVLASKPRGYRSLNEL
jgi:hypothetical protein